MTSADQLVRYRTFLTWTFFASLPLLVAVHAPMLPSDALAHRAYHAAESVLGPAFSAVVHLGFVAPAVSLAGVVLVTVLARRR